VSSQPRYGREEVARRIAAGGLTRWQVYALEHQHPLNRLLHAFGIPLILFSAIWLVVSWPLTGEIGWRWWLLGQGIGWPLQILGHAIEGNRPAFFKDPWQLTIGPLFIAWEPIRALLGRPLVELPPEESA
jgi:uncharacterized membrane protein YGL010W